MINWVALDELCTFNRGTTITAQNAVHGSIPVVSGGQKPAYYHNVSNREADCITIAGSGAYAGYVSYWDKPIFCADSFTVDSNDKNILLPKYLYYWLCKEQKTIYNKKKGAGIAHVHGADIAKMKIPVPHIAEQHRIVSILDKFDMICNNLCEGLPAEIDLMTKKYEYYRDLLLSF